MEVETVVEAEVDAWAVDVTVTVEVMWTVVCETPPATLVDAPPGGGRRSAPLEEGALAVKAWVATKTDPAPARTTRTRTETTDSL